MSSPDPSARTAYEVGDELTRVARRWQQLPLGHALSHAPAVHAAVQELADRVAVVTGMAVQPVPDLGPAVVIDQLRVMAHDHRAAGLPEEDLLEALVRLRRGLP